jgi:hypothetical protein
MLVIVESHLNAERKIAGKKCRRDFRWQYRLGRDKARDAHGIDSQSGTAEQFDIALDTNYPVKLDRQRAAPVIKWPLAFEIGVDRRQIGEAGKVRDQSGGRFPHHGIETEVIVAGPKNGGQPSMPGDAIGSVYRQ